MRTALLFICFCLCLITGYLAKIAGNPIPKLGYFLMSCFVGVVGGTLLTDWKEKEKAK